MVPVAAQVTLVAWLPGTVTPCRVAAGEGRQQVGGTLGRRFCFGGGSPCADLRMAVFRSTCPQGRNRKEHAC